MNLVPRVTSRGTTSQRGIFVAVIAASALLLTACPRPNGYQAAPVFPHINFSQMVGFHPISGDGEYAAVLTQDGFIYRANLGNNAEQPSLYLDLRNRLIADPGNEEGLLGLAFPPDFATSRRFYVNYSAGNPRRSVISRFTAPGAAADPASERVILEVPQPAANHNGGALAFGPDGMLYIALGDGGGAGDPNRNGQNVNTILGKILRIDVSGDGYTVPADNPFAAGGGRGEIWAWGLRNPWRIAFDTVTGQLWTADVGEAAWEEVDRIVRAGNYGWGTLEGDFCYRTACVTPAGALAPRATYSHDFGCSVTGGYVYRGTSMPELQGWYIYGDFCSGRVWAVDIASDDGAAIPLADTGRSISSFAQDNAGEVYLVTFNDAIYRLERTSE